MNPDTEYTRLLSTPTDMQYHLPLLRGLADGKRVTEFGTHDATSATAFIAGRPKMLICYDRDRTAEVDNLIAMAAEARVPFVFHEQDLDEVSSILPMDVLFVDAQHHAEGVRHYLGLGRNAGASVIALHDTEIFGRNGNPIEKGGILDAVDEMLEAFPEWQITYQTQECYGLTLLSRHST